MDILLSMIAFFALVASWFVLPATAPALGTVKSTTSAAETLAPAA
jgi:hypothetical protein